ncbi:hypothetical protein Aristophanes_00004 [Acinetobacter phage Aristophanes]|uniref:Uncharacterized protein n=1 Tax=Acinetobacter phage Aristophanes TaxID=2759203 RepID=A0A7G9VYL3_BPACA|nr:hypothetical protein Aristophanes_00004 [Acinetobacter phage Aristophanes]
MAATKPVVQPVDVRLNGIVMQCLRETLATMMVNNGITIRYTSRDVPETGKAIHAMWEQAKLGMTPFRVLNSANDPENLYFSPQANLLYRAVHDIDHALWYSAGKGTTKFEHELFLNCLMAKRVYDWCMQDVYYTEQDALRVFFAMYHDTVGQVYYYREHNDFCVNQRNNTVKLMSECKGVWATQRGMLRIAYNVMQSYLRECGL